MYGPPHQPRSHEHDKRCADRPLDHELNPAREASRRIRHMNPMLSTLLIRHRVQNPPVSFRGHSPTSSYLREGNLNIVFSFLVDDCTAPDTRPTSTTTSGGTSSRDSPLSLHSVIEGDTVRSLQNLSGNRFQPPHPKSLETNLVLVLRLSPCAVAQRLLKQHAKKTEQPSRMTRVTPRAQ